MEQNPAVSKKVVSEEEYANDLIESAIEMVIRKMRWRAMNMSLEDFQDWVLNCEVTDFKTKEE
jgi:hypothetical protein